MFFHSFPSIFEANRDPAHPSLPSACSCLASNPKFAQEDPRSGKFSAVGSPIGSAPEQLFPTISAKCFFFRAFLFFKGVQVTNKGDQSDPYSKIASHKKVSGVLFRWKGLLGDMMINQWIYVFRSIFPREFLVF